ncbi:hypothetical protein RO3G_15072 [Rhizopus delemar RA 99-880]|uniref:Protein kinase domain-containing protein n=1 Tax=Rhizopus delemar (strain RA 99-880 / ATCC MYA-4621 / FGSC 9543 / NRRL 43880) TaxID=246409 RepID=I1CPI1_RHIO9|nr:hypothetical protein RO3G_15072 [Rhizopus delemar RA 99-880]|eukprot:EIE90361.1 hypothetical protein RO3G_15072 [Rhizopus delemar RA 99-880]
MAVFNQIKNFIKTSYMGGQKYEAAARIVQEELKAKNTMPNYPGLAAYQLTAKLGDGAFSVVYEALKLKTNEKVAIKVVKKAEINNHQYYFLVLELCEGGELFHQIVRLTYLSEDLARHCIKQVAEGIQYLHEEKGIVHRRPWWGGGIGQVKIADFGLSKVIWDEQTRTPCGTVGYTAPEIVNDKRYSMSVDMWALGCVLYTLLCGFPPFYDESISVLTEKVARGRYTFLSPWWDGISGEAKDLITKLLCVDPKKRYTIDQFLEHPWINKQNVDNTKVKTVPSDFLIDAASKPIPSEIANGVTDKQKETEAEAYKRLILERNRDEAELEAAVPVSGVSSVLNSRANSRTPSVVASGASTPRRDLFSGISSMKEMFDISYTVHRMAEEKARGSQDVRDIFKAAVSAQALLN